VWLADHDPHTANFDKALLGPRGQDAAHGRDSGTGHFGDILARYREVNQDSVFRLTPRLFDKTGKSTRHAALYVFRREFPDSRMHILQLPADGVKRAYRQCWMALRHFIPQG
jgi:hypothetical protein